VASSLDPREALAVFEDLQRSQQEGLAVGGELHLLFLATPVSPAGAALDVPWQRFFDLFTALPPPARAVAARVGVEESALFAWRTRRARSAFPRGAPAGAARARQVAARFFAALVLEAVLAGGSLTEVPHPPRAAGPGTALG
jgi:hypothetical protein